MMKRLGLTDVGVAPEHASLQNNRPERAGIHPVATADLIFGDQRFLMVQSRLNDPGQPRCDTRTFFVIIILRDAISPLRRVSNVHLDIETAS